MPLQPGYRRPWCRFPVLWDQCESLEENLSDAKKRGPTPEGDWHEPLKTFVSEKTHVQAEEGGKKYEPAA